MKTKMKNFVVIIVTTILTIDAFAYDFEVDGLYYDINSDGTTVSVTYENDDYDSYSGDIVIPAAVTYNNVTYNVTCIGELAFHRCRNLYSVIIPEGVTTIGNSAFSFCTRLNTVTLPNSLVVIEDRAFSSTDLRSIDIPDGITTIGMWTFSSCQKLTSINIPSSVTSIEEYAFCGCTSLPSITIPESITTIEDGVFWSCGGLHSITIPSGVENIGFLAFSGCRSLTSITIPSRVIYIDESAFEGCDHLTEFICEAQIPPTLHNEALKNVDLRNIVLRVPCGKIPDYLNAENWNSFFKYADDCGNVGIEYIAEETGSLINVYPNPAKENITLTACEDILIYNSLGQGVKHIPNPKGETTISISELPKGIYYLKSGDRQQKLIKE